VSSTAPVSPARTTGVFAFAAATFLGAFLLFLVQPLIAKYLLPWFGGSPAVWTGCMLFFQGVLLAGYTYAHLGARRLSLRGNALLHLAVLTVAAAAVAISVLHPPRQPDPVGAAELAPLGQMLLLLTRTVGLPALALSATSPLLNSWYARTSPAAGAGVYRLYAISNAGSLLALVAYPFAVEPAMTRRAQVVVWSAAFLLFAVLCAYLATRAARSLNRPAHATGADQDTPGRVGLATRLLWLALPACASVLLLATTNAMTYSVAPVPLLWVLPLALYLLTFILAFDERRWYRRNVAGLPLVFAAAGVCWVLLGVQPGAPAASRVGILAGSMFVCCMVCHGELAALKPPPARLTAYYLSIAAGGALGGFLVAVVAPLVFDRYAELHLAVWACCLLALATPYLAGAAGRRPSGVVAMLSIAGLVVLATVLWTARDPYSLGAGTAIARVRDLYGVLTVYESSPGEPARANRVLRHAGVAHGQQFLDPDRRRKPTTYYGDASGIAAALDTVGSRLRRVGVVGLGTGTLAARGAPGDVLRFYELSPTVERVARQYFTYLSDSPARCEVVIGDARLSLEREPPQGFDVLVLDAFSGHAIPTHLLTREAFALYHRHLAPGGVVAVHVSNRYVDLEPVVAQQAAHGGWEAVLITSDGDESEGLHAADWVVVADADRVAGLHLPGMRRPRHDPKLPLWTDDYASVYHVLR
jgi:SAM-dependent methyltransferase